MEDRATLHTLINEVVEFREKGKHKEASLFLGLLKRLYRKAGSRHKQVEEGEPTAKPLLLQDEEDVV